MIVTQRVKKSAVGNIAFGVALLQHTDEIYKIYNLRLVLATNIILIDYCIFARSTCFYLLSIYAVGLPRKCHSSVPKSWINTGRYKTIFEKMIVRDGFWTIFKIQMLKIYWKMDKERNILISLSIKLWLT